MDIQFTKKEEKTTKPKTTTMTAEPTEATVVTTIDEIAETTQANLPALTLKSEEGKRIVDIIKIDDADKAAAMAMVESFNIRDTNAVAVFAVTPQKRYLDQLKMLLQDSRISDTGVADVIIGIEEGIDMVDLAKIKKEIMEGKIGSFLSKWFGAYKAFMKNRQKIVDHINGIEQKIAGQVEELAEENARMDVMYEDVKTNFYQLGVYLYAGEEIRDRAKIEYNEMCQQNLDPTGQAELNRFREQINAFDTRLLRIKTAYVKAPLKMQELLIQQQAGRTEMNSMIEALTFDLPEFVECLNQLIGLEKIKRAQNNRKKLDSVRDKLRDAKDEILEDVAVEAKEGQLAGVKEVEEVEKSAEKVIALCQKLRDLDKRNADARKTAETTLVDVSTGFEAAMKDINRPDAV